MSEMLVSGASDLDFGSCTGHTQRKTKGDSFWGRRRRRTPARTTPAEFEIKTNASSLLVLLLLVVVVVLRVDPRNDDNPPPATLHGGAAFLLLSFATSHTFSPAPPRQRTQGPANTIHVDTAVLAPCRSTRIPRTPPGGVSTSAHRRATLATTRITPIQRIPRPIPRRSPPASRGPRYPDERSPLPRQRLPFHITHPRSAPHHHSPFSATTRRPRTAVSRRRCASSGPPQRLAYQDDARAEQAHSAGSRTPAPSSIRGVVPVTRAVHETTRERRPYAGTADDSAPTGAAAHRPPRS
ncbi:hypothetical protein PLICRDRAFT_697759 [Plicaturopsis crispa FD-325 SS-3]|nr:hypothetical protein PLICRDRAFT_697759 [Plicaturopsis crispa FD-325 SS-3]